MPVIYCNFNIGNYKHSIHYVDDKASTELGNFTTDELPEAIAVAAASAGVHKVNIQALKIYGQALASEITTYASSKFSNYDLEVEIIEK